MNEFTFALNGLPYSDYDVKKFTKQVKTKGWIKKFRNSLSRWQDRITTANADKKQVIGGMLHAAYGVNIGEQILSNLSENDLIKIRSNLINIYNYK